MVELVQKEALLSQLDLVYFRDLLEQIKDFEEQEFMGAKRDSDFKVMTTRSLEPLNESGGAALLNMVFPSFPFHF